MTAPNRPPGSLPLSRKHGLRTCSLTGTSNRAGLLRTCTPAPSTPRARQAGPPQADSPPTLTERKRPLGRVRKRASKQIPTLHFAPTAQAAKGSYANIDGLERTRRHLAHNLFEVVPILNATPANQLSVTADRAGSTTSRRQRGIGFPRETPERPLRSRPQQCRLPSSLMPQKSK